MLKSLDYTYAVARIRALEVSLLDNVFIEQLLSCENYDMCISLLSEKGFGDGNCNDALSMLKREEEKIWEVIYDIAPEKSVFDVFFYPKIYHNLKAAIKQVCTETENENIFYDDCQITGEQMLSIIKNKDFDKLFGNMPEVAKEAYQTLLHNRDGQLCDIIIDKATLEAIYQAGKKSNENIIKEYANDFVAIADIKMAIRAQKTNKSLDFIKRSLVHCDSINIDNLANSALKGIDGISNYLLGTEYASSVEALKKSPSAFEIWCDNRMIQNMQSQKYKSFSIGPLVAYIIARENEIKTVRIILTGKQNNFPAEAIRERIRQMYV